MLGAPCEDASAGVLPGSIGRLDGGHETEPALLDIDQERPRSPAQLGEEPSLRDLAVAARPPEDGKTAPAQAASGHTPPLQGPLGSTESGASASTPGSEWLPAQSALAALPGVLRYEAADAEDAEDADLWASQSQGTRGGAQGACDAPVEGTPEGQASPAAVDGATEVEEAGPDALPEVNVPALPGHDRAGHAHAEQPSVFSQEGLGDFSQQGHVSGEPARVIFHVDVDAFYCQVEALDNPALRGRPLAVQQGNSGGFVAVSYEAQARGVQKGDGVGAGGRAAIRRLQEIGALSPALATPRL